jgi:hypothetical protein
MKTAVATKYPLGLKNLHGDLKILVLSLVVNKSHQI